MAGADPKSQATVYARLAEASAQKTGLLDSGADAEKLIDDAGLPNVLPVSAESAGMLPKRSDK
ncbi:hypothetical protein JCGZ_22176 [Jatropha curcas]|uniref:Uncharacterized protein n=1 Tax=Jatropha curcas TaxID=180498 RepID=A0A067LJX0_JATCU|nr:hypothetical protein JCGZ_22176 [Jatropha curcas]